MSHEVQQFKTDATRQTGDLRHRSLIQRALKGYEAKRDENKAKFQNWQAARQSAAETKFETIEHLDSYLEEFTAKIEARGTKVFWAPSGQDACDYIVRVATERGVKSIIKSKSMTAEEIHLGPALEKQKFRVVETDLGEYIVQLREEPPYHIVFPSMHLTRDEISDLFQKKLGSAPTNVPEELTMIAREKLRNEYISADMGISGVNFAVAETGMVAITENEGNSRLTCGIPKIHIAIMGIEKLVPKLEDLALFLPMLATAGAGQQITGYNTLYGGPRTQEEADGPEEFHLVIMDNGRTRLLADPEQRDALHCIRCGACLNVCPIFRNVGGHAYGTTYQGPIGSVITPHLRGLRSWKHLSSASSLCGACSEACPLKIELHHHLLQNRRNGVRDSGSLFEKVMFTGFVLLMKNPTLFRLAGKLGGFAQNFHGLISGSCLDPAQAWSRTRELPKVAPKNFKQLWEERKK